MWPGADLGRSRPPPFPPACTKTDWQSVPNLVDPEDMRVVREFLATVIANDFRVVRELASTTHVSVVHTGGQLDRPNLTGIGPLAAATLRHLSLTSRLPLRARGMRGVE
jgi:hypothetical protein